MDRLDQYIQSNLNSFGGFPKKVKQEIEKVLALRKSSISNFVNRCESPIEQLLAVHLIDTEELLYRELSVLSNFKSIHIVPQREVMTKGRKYRLDFLIECVMSNMVHLIAIECDGHDFHEKTKEQAARDKARERNLMSEGYNIVRFTGSEIWKNPVSCTIEVVDIVQNMAGLDEYYKKIFEE